MFRATKNRIEELHDLESIIQSRKHLDASEKAKLVSNLHELMGLSSPVSDEEMNMMSPEPVEKVEGRTVPYAPWSEEQEFFLLSLMKDKRGVLRGEKEVGDIVAEFKERFPSRSRRAVKAKWTRLSAGRSVPYAPWTNEQEEHLEELMEGAEKPKKIAGAFKKRFPSRSKAAVKAKWNSMK